MPSVLNPAGYVPSTAVAFDRGNGTAATVSPAAPLPVYLTHAATPPLAGNCSNSQQIGPFAATVGRPVILALSGTWTGSVNLLRSTDVGTSRLPVTQGGAPSALFSGNCCEAVWDESENGALLYLDVIVASGTLVYRLAQ
jgi:hypothetical protein